MTLKELRDNIIDIDMTCAPYKTFRKLYNTMKRYWFDTGDYLCEPLFDDYLEKNTAIEHIQNMLPNDGIERVWEFLEYADPSAELFRISTDGKNLLTADEAEMDTLQDDILDAITYGIKERG